MSGSLSLVVFSKSICLINKAAVLFPFPADDGIEPIDLGFGVVPFNGLSDRGIVHNIKQERTTRYQIGAGFENIF